MIRHVGAGLEMIAALSRFTFTEIARPREE